MWFSVWTRWISLSFCQTWQSLADEAWGPLQSEHRLGPSHWPSCLSFLQPVHFAATLQRWLVCPNLLQLKQCTGLGTNKATFTFRQPTVINFGSDHLKHHPHKWKAVCCPAKQAHKLEQIKDYSNWVKYTSFRTDSTAILPNCSVLLSSSLVPQSFFFFKFKQLNGPTNQR